MALRLATVRETGAAKAGYAEEVRKAAEFRVDVTREGGTVRVCPVGELDMATTGRVRTHLDDAIAAGDGPVILDLRETTFLDSSALHLAVEAYNRALSEAIGFAIVPGPPLVQRAFDIAGLGERLPFVDVPHG